MDLAKYIKDNQDDLDFCMAEIHIELQTQILLSMDKENVSRTELADKLGVNKSHVTRLLQGDKNFTLRTLMKICIALELRPEIFLQKKKKHKPLGGLIRFKEERSKESREGFKFVTKIRDATIYQSGSSLKPCFENRAYHQLQAQVS